jgi:hypothetical protein
VKSNAGNANIGNDQAEDRLLQQRKLFIISVDNFDNDDVMKVFPNHQPD